MFGRLASLPLPRVTAPPCSTGDENSSLCAALVELPNLVLRQALTGRIGKSSMLTNHSFSSGNLNLDQRDPRSKMKEADSFNHEDQKKLASYSCYLGLMNTTAS